MNSYVSRQSIQVPKKPATDPTPGLVSYYNTEGAPPPGKVDVSYNVLDVHDVSVPRDVLEMAHGAKAGVSFKLVGSLHSHTVNLSPAQVGALIATGHLEIQSQRAVGHSHKVTLSPGDGSAAHDVRVCGVRIAKKWVKV